MKLNIWPWSEIKFWKARCFRFEGQWIRECNALFEENECLKKELEEYEN